MVVVSAFVTSTVLVLLLISACGLDLTGVASSGPTDDATGPSLHPDTGAQSSSGAGGDGSPNTLPDGAPIDAGPDSNLPLPSTTYSCGPLSCVGEPCCSDGGGPLACGACSGGNDFAFECLTAADCKGGNVCCFGAAGQSSCKPSCNAILEGIMCTPGPGDSGCNGPCSPTMCDGVGGPIPFNICKRGVNSPINTHNCHLGN